MDATQEIKIDRSKDFNLVHFAGSNSVIEWQDSRSLAFTQIDLSAIKLKPTISPWDRLINGEENFQILQNAGYICADAKFYQLFLENQDIVPESWKEKFKSRNRHIYFPGTVIKLANGSRSILGFYFYCGRLAKVCKPLASGWYEEYFSAVIDL